MLYLRYLLELGTIQLASLESRPQHYWHCTSAVRNWTDTDSTWRTSALVADQASRVTNEKQSRVPVS